MTRDEVLAMKPGPELDALVAEKVMGWASLWTDGEYYMMYPPSEQKLGVGYDERHPVPYYSTDIAAAFEVWEHDRPEDWIMTINWTDGQYTAKIMTVNEDGLKYVAKIEADTAAEAMVKCRLLAVGVSGE